MVVPAAAQKAAKVSLVVMNAEMSPVECWVDVATPSCGCSEDKTARKSLMAVTAGVGPLLGDCKEKYAYLVVCCDKADEEDYERDDERDGLKTLDPSWLEMEDAEQRGKECCQASPMVADAVAPPVRDSKKM